MAKENLLSVSRRPQLQKGGRVRPSKSTWDKKAMMRIGIRMPEHDTWIRYTHKHKQTKAPPSARVTPRVEAQGTNTQRYARYRRSHTGIHKSQPTEARGRFANAQTHTLQYIRRSTWDHSEPLQYLTNRYTALNRLIQNLLLESSWIIPQICFAQSVQAARTLGTYMLAHQYAQTCIPCHFAAQFFRAICTTN